MMMNVGDRIVVMILGGGGYGFDFNKLEIK